MLWLADVVAFRILLEENGCFRRVSIQEISFWRKICQFFQGRFLETKVITVFDYQIMDHIQIIIIPIGIIVLDSICQEAIGLKRIQSRNIVISVIKQFVVLGFQLIDRYSKIFPSSVCR